MDCNGKRAYTARHESGGVGEIRPFIGEKPTCNSNLTLGLGAAFILARRLFSRLLLGGGQGFKQMWVFAKILAYYLKLRVKPNLACVNLHPHADCFSALSLIFMALE